MWYVWYALDEYEGWSLKVLEDEDDVKELLNSYASNPDFEFKVVQGREIEYRPVTVATKYERA